MCILKLSPDANLMNSKLMCSKAARVGLHLNLNSGEGLKECVHQVYQDFYHP